MYTGHNWPQLIVEETPLSVRILSNAILRIVLLAAIAAGYAQQPPPDASSRSLIEEIRAHRSGVAVWWLGHNGWLIKSGDTLIGTDLVLEDSNRMVPPPISAADLATELDISFVTHGHGDHFHRATSKTLFEQGHCTFVIPKSCVDIAHKLEITDARIRVATPREEPFEIEGVRIQPIRAIHGNPKFAVYERANLEDSGYVLTIGGKSFLQPGDSVLLEDHLFLKHVDVLFFSPTEHNMHIDRSVILINELEPDYILPQHRDTYIQTQQNHYWTHGYAREVSTYLAKPLRERYRILKPGERLLIE
jgi:L-ascorbate metabolism protein UlaG (beta-lactamase superfamily)